jgi:hypothetical protein
MPELGMDPVCFDLAHLVQRNVASLYSSLVTRPTGQAVRMAIENVLAEEASPYTLSIIDLSQITIIDFSCADEVVAKLLLRYLGEERPKDAFFLFRGLKDLHRGPIEVVLQRQSLATVAEREDGGWVLIGALTPAEEKAWQALEREGILGDSDLGRLFPESDEKQALESLVEKRVVFRNPLTGDYRALSSLV